MMRTATEQIEIPAGAAAMSLHFGDADPISACHVGDCSWHGHGDSLRDAAGAWLGHLTAVHVNDWE